jgi:hypothetical protein
MTKDEENHGRRPTVKVINEQGPMGFVLFVAFFGAVVYFAKQATDFWTFILAILKAIVWPAFLLYHGLQALGV